MRRIVIIARRQRECYGRSSIRGNHMNLGVPSAAGLANGLRSVFFKAPVPSGWTFTDVESREKASILMRTICSVAAAQTRGPTRRSWPTGSCACRSCARGRNRFGSPRHLQPCSATYRIAFSTCRLVRLTLPRCNGRLSLMRAYCSGDFHLLQLTRYCFISVNTP